MSYKRYKNTTNKFVSRLEGEPLQDHPKKEVIKIEKNKRLICRVSEKEYEKFEKLVEKSKLTKSEFMRKSIGFNSIPSLSELNNKIYDMMTGSEGFKYLVKGGALLKKKATYKDKTTSKEIEPTEEIQKAAVFAFSKYILNKL